jgi:hypothetical protein
MCLEVETKDRCIRCHKLRNSLTGVPATKWKCSFPEKRRSKTYQVMVMYQRRSVVEGSPESKTLFMKMYPLPKKFEEYVFKEVVFLDSSHSSDLSSQSEEDSDLYFDRIIRGNDALSEEELQEHSPENGVIIKSTVTDKELYPPPLSDSSDGDVTKTIYRVRPPITWFYELEGYHDMETKTKIAYSIKNIRVVLV